MKIYQTNQIRNIALLGNAGSGKTTLAETLAFNSGLITRRGDIAGKNTLSDFREIEQHHGSSIFPAATYSEINDVKINIIDNPGLDDFCNGVISSLRVSDCAIILINAQNGIEVGTEIQARHCQRFKKPVVLAITHLDHDKANIDKTYEQLKERFGAKVVITQYPVSTGQSFQDIIDLISMKMYKYTNDSGKPEIHDIPTAEKSKAEELRTVLIEKAAESDEKLMELFFEKGSLTEEELFVGLKSGLMSRNLFPVLAISSKKNYGVNRMLDIVSKLAPDPSEVGTEKMIDGKEIKIDASGSPTLFIYKTSYETHVGEVSYFKVISGKIEEGADLVNSSNQNKERLNQINVSLGKNRTKVSTLVAGDLGCTVKLKGSKSNQTLCATGSTVIAPIVFPEPKYRTAIKTLKEGEEEKLGVALHQMAQEDPTIIVEYSKELKQIIIHGQGEYHLDIMKWHLDNIFKIETEFLPPRIPYRETITKVAQADYRHKKQSGGAGQFGEVHMIIEPHEEGKADPTMYKIDGKEQKVSVRGKEEHVMPWGGKLVFYNCIVGGSIEARFLPAIMKGLMEKMEEGPLTGSYARDIRVSVYDGKMHPVDSNEISFKIAGRNAFKEAFKKAAPKILEPIYDVQVYVPSEKMGDVMSDLQGRRAMVQGMSSDSGFEIINAKIPLAELNKYSTALNSLTSGRAMYTMKFADYQQVPGDLQEKLLKDYESKQEKEE